MEYNVALNKPAAFPIHPLLVRQGACLDWELVIMQTQCQVGSSNIRGLSTSLLCLGGKVSILLVFGEFDKFHSRV